MPNATLEALSQKIWDHVCENITLILKECDLHGLSGILTVPDPSIENRITALKKLDVVCELIIAGTDGDYNVSRNMFNAKQQILNLEILLNAAKNNDDEGFNRAKECLNGQSTH